MSQETSHAGRDNDDKERESISAEPETTTPKLDVRRLEAIQRWAQYASVAALLITVVLFALASHKLSGLYADINRLELEKANSITTLLTQQETMRDNNAKIESQKKTIEDQKATIGILNSTQLKLGQGKLAPTGAALKARIYIQIANGDQRERARRVQGQLEERGFVIPGIENIAGKANAPPVSHLRYYQNDSETDKDVKDIVDVLNGMGVKLKVVQLPPSSGVRPRHYEIWFAADF